ncbi:MAG: regulatory protein marr [Frankiales bacterium]|nr:regulatory protein marr [Frankiales bacterium]
MSEFRWLTEPEQRAWRAYLEGSQLLANTLERELHSECGLSAADYEIFVRLSEADGRRMRMSDLADRTLYSRSRLSHAVTRLEKEGWLRREDCADDKRGTYAELTDAGFDKLVMAAPRHVDGVRRHLIDRLSPDQIQQLQEIMTSVRDVLLDGHTPREVLPDPRPARAGS